MSRTRRRRIVAGCLLLTLAAGLLIMNPDSYQTSPSPTVPAGGSSVVAPGSASQALEGLVVKGRSAKTGYSRDQFGGWSMQAGCDTRNRILLRDLTDTVVDSQCRVVSGRLNDPYTGQVISFIRGANTSSIVQIDHVVALSDAWQKGAQLLSPTERIVFANDPLELLAVDGKANEQKSGSDAATWLPPNKPFRCQYVARQIAVKQKYMLWVTQAERDAMRRVLSACPEQSLPESPR